MLVVCVCVCVRARAFVCVRACVRVCILYSTVLPVARVLGLYDLVFIFETIITRTPSELCGCIAVHSTSLGTDVCLWVVNSCTRKLEINCCFNERRWL